jgi:predicted membrane channel-forming protein YqfA (hemolysin III family)
MEVLRDRRRILQIVAALSIAVSLSLVVVTFAAPALPIWLLIVINWLLFAGVTWLAGHQISLFGKWETITPENHRVWRIVIIAFSGCGFIAIAAGARIV